MPRHAVLGSFLDGECCFNPKFDSDTVETVFLSKLFGEVSNTSAWDAFKQDHRLGTRLNCTRGGNIIFR